MSRAALENAYRAYHAQDFTAATALCESVLARERKNAHALDLLGQLAWVTGRREESVEYHKLAAQAAPKHAALRTNLGRALARVDRHREAIVQFDAALKLEPGHPAAVSGKASSYIRQNKHDRARRLLEREAQRGPLDPAVAVPYVALLVRDGELVTAIEIGRGVIDAGCAASDFARTLHFEVARAYERHGDYDQAFDMASRGNATLPPVFDPADAARAVDLITDTFAAERLATMPRAAPTAGEPIFVFGMPRSGTTLTERILDAHPNVYGVGESDGIPQLVRAMPEFLRSAGADLQFDDDKDYLESVAQIDEPTAEAMRRSYLESVARDAGPGQRVADKNLSNYLHVGLITRLFPGASLVHCRRDPIDTCVSCFFEPLAQAVHPYASDLSHLGLYYRAYDRLMRHWAAVLPGRIFDVQYETLVADQEAVTRRLLDACDLPWDERCLRYYDTDRLSRTLSAEQVRRPVYTTSVGRGDRYGSRLDPLRAALATTTGATAS